MAPWKPSARGPSSFPSSRGTGGNRPAPGGRLDGGGDRQQRAAVADSDPMVEASVPYGPVSSSWAVTVGVWHLGSIGAAECAVIVPGVVQVDSYRKTIQHLEGGIVKEILVRAATRWKGTAAHRARRCAGRVRGWRSERSARRRACQAGAVNAEIAVRRPSPSDDLLQRRDQSPKLDAMLAADRPVQARRDLVDGQVAILQAQMQTSRRDRGLSAQVARSSATSAS